MGRHGGLLLNKAFWDGFMEMALFDLMPLKSVCNHVLKATEDISRRHLLGGLPLGPGSDSIT
jgi:hypothetical protein